jgi:hypothetical protein
MCCKTDVALANELDSLERFLAVLFVVRKQAAQNLLCLQTNFDR